MTSTCKGPWLRKPSENFRMRFKRSKLTKRKDLISLSPKLEKLNSRRLKCPPKSSLPERPINRLPLRKIKLKMSFKTSWLSKRKILRGRSKT